MSPKKWPPNPEEIDAKLAELRADPDKAARFRADLIARTQRAFDKLGKLERPLDDLISEAFSFLVDDYGFTEHAKQMVGLHSATTLKEYSSQKVIVSVGAGGFDNGTFCGIGLKNRESGRDYGFEALLLKRYPQFEHPRYAGSTEVVRSHLTMYAAALRKYAEDVLLGDFNAFGE